MLLRDQWHSKFQKMILHISTLSAALAGPRRACRAGEKSHLRVYTRDILQKILWGLKRQKFSWSFLTRHLYTRQLACEPQTGSLAYFSVAVRTERKNDQVSRSKFYIQQLLLLLYLYARTNSAKVHGNLNKLSIWKHEIKLMACHYKQAAREKYLAYSNSLECAVFLLGGNGAWFLSD